MEKMLSDIDEFMTFFVLGVILLALALTLMLAAHVVLFEAIPHIISR